MTRRDGHTDETFVTFVATRSPRLIAYAELLCGNHEQARDIVQTVLTRAYPRWRHIFHNDPYGYLCRGVTNAVTDWWRSAYRRHENPVDDLPESPGTAATTLTFEDRDVLLAALSRLTTRERTIVVLRYLDDHTERDVAAMLSISHGTVKSTCHTALRKMRVALDDHTVTGNLGRN